MIFRTHVNLIFYMDIAYRSMFIGLNLRIQLTEVGLWIIKQNKKKSTTKQIIYHRFPFFGEKPYIFAPIEIPRVLYGLKIFVLFNDC